MEKRLRQILRLRLPHAQVYLDAGNPGMFANPARLAGPLVRAGIRAGRDSRRTWRTSSGRAPW
jgi:hypothetical protein